MSTELFINSTQKGDRIALLQDKRLIELHLEKKENSFTVGDIYLGVVKKVANGLNAAFVDVGYEKDAFLHYLDLGPQFQSLVKFTKLAQSNKNASHKLNSFKLEDDIDKNGKISDVLSRNNQILVQVVKEPISTKGPRLSCEISLPGRYIVLVPFTDSINVSKKIEDKAERNRLIRLLTSIKPDNFGIIVRTVAEGKEVAELDKDLTDLMERWESGFKALKTAKPKDKIIGEIGRASSILRDMMNANFDAITVDSPENYTEIREYLELIAPDRVNILKQHSGKHKLFEAAGVEKQIKSLFGKSVSLPGGGYLVIEHTEALHVVDVNSGNKSTSGADQETTALNVNLEAAKEMARQLRLRDMGGIIVIDFIDMRKADHRQKLLEKMKEEMAADRSKYTILPLSKFGLMQITRQRVRPEMNIVTKEVCPTCNGTGSITASLAVTAVIESNLDFLLTKQNEKNISIALHPFLFAYYDHGVISRRVKWFMKYNKWVNLIEDSSLGITQFKFLNRQREEIEMAQ